MVDLFSLNEAWERNSFCSEINSVFQKNYITREKLVRQRRLDPPTHMLFTGNEFCNFKLKNNYQRPEGIKWGAQYVVYCLLTHFFQILCFGFISTYFYVPQFLL